MAFTLDLFFSNQLTRRNFMYAISGAFGQTGIAVSQALLNAGKSIRMIVRRDDAQAAHWREKGAEVVVADLSNSAEMVRAFENVTAAYLMNPPAYFVPDLFVQAHQVHTNIINAANAAGVARVVALSSVGAQHEKGTGNILTTHDFEVQLKNYKGSLTILRAANFMENWAWSIHAVREKGILTSMFHPVTTALPMVSAQDIGRVAAKLLQDTPTHNRTVELHGPQDYSPLDAADVFSQLLNRQINAIEESASDWSASMLSKGFPPTTVDAFVEMFAGFNSGLISFEDTHETMYGEVTLTAVLTHIIHSAERH
jgi:uncharacterized protein YbjT (DUF2867 family)